MSVLLSGVLALGLAPTLVPDIAVADESAAFLSSFEAGDMAIVGEDVVIGSDSVASDGETPGMRTFPSDGPAESWTSAANVGFTGVASLEYSGDHSGAESGYSYNRLFEVDIPVQPETRLSYKLFPAQMTDDLTAGLPSPSTFVAVNLEFADGSTLRDLEAVDAYGFDLDAAAQGQSKVLYSDSGTTSAPTSARSPPDAPSLASRSSTRTRPATAPFRVGWTTSPSRTSPRRPPSTSPTG